MNLRGYIIVTQRPQFTLEFTLGVVHSVGLDKCLMTRAHHYRGFPGGSVVKNPPANAEDVGSVPGLGRSPGGGNGNPLQYSWLENSMDIGAWRAPVHGVAKESGTTERSAAPVITASSSVFTAETRSALGVSLLTTHPGNHWSFHCFRSFAFLESYSCDHTVCSLFRLPYFT